MELKLIRTIEDIPKELFTNKLLHRSGTVDGKYVVKYSKRAFYQQAWKEYPILAKVRGLVIDESTGKVIGRPFDKVYNYTENGAGVGLENRKVEAIIKVNGFLGVATYTDNKEWIFSTTGTLDSDFVKMFRGMFDRIVPRPIYGCFTPGCSYMFEVVHKDDPHIVKEDFGLHLIGARLVETGELFNEDSLDGVYLSILNQIKDYDLGNLWHRPTHVSGYTLKEYIESAEECHKETGNYIEGIMLRDTETGEFICKYKTSYYLNKKFLMRVKRDEYLRKWLKQNEDETFDEEIQMIVDKIKSGGVEQYLSLQEQERFQ